MSSSRLPASARPSGRLFDLGLLDVPVKDAIRFEDPIPAIHRVLWETARIKPAAGRTLPEESSNRTMSQIGG